MIKHKPINPEGYKYEVTEQYCYETNIKGHFIELPDEFISLFPTGELCLDPGFRWDGSSSISIDTETNKEASAVHDAGYRMIVLGNLHMKTRRKWDKEMRRISRKNNMWFGRRWYTWVGVRLFAKYAAEPAEPVGVV